MALLKIRSFRGALSISIFGVLISLAACDVPTPSVEQTEPKVEIASGTLAGSATPDGEILVYKGIPFAAPPVGSLRWRAPQPIEAWDGVRNATEFSPACMQPQRPPGSFYPSYDNVSEDCLYLNVWTAANSSEQKRPVMVWIPGGAFLRGAGSASLYNGEALARRGVVLVTINYRLGPFGFLAHSLLSAEDEHDSSGNYGFLDQIAALEWVRDNITAFGGDPQQVTIFGESAGGTSANYLMASPIAKGLFHRAIGESTSSFSQLRQSKEDAEEVGERFASALLGDEAVSLESLRATAAEEIISTELAESAGFTPRGNVDGWFLRDTVYNVFASGMHNDVPLLVGWNADEASAMLGSRGPQDLEGYRKWAEERFGALAGPFLELYPASTDEDARRAFIRSSSDSGIGWSMRTWAALVQRGGSDAFLYYFTRVPPEPDSDKYGAYHTAEIAYVFETLGRGFRPETKYEDIDYELSNLMASYWVNFAKTGNPNGEGLPEWPVYDPDSGVTMVFGDKTEAREGVLKAQLDLFDQHHAALRATPES